MKVLIHAALLASLCMVAAWASAPAGATPSASQPAAAHAAR